MAVLNVQLQALFDRALDGILLAGDDQRCIDANPAACELLGLARDQVVQRRVSDFAPFGDVDDAWRRFLRHGQGGGTFELNRPDGTRRVVEYNAIANIQPGVHLSIVRDATARMHLEEVRGRLAAIVRSSDDAIMASNLDDLITDWNAGAERIYGYSEHEALGSAMARLVPPERRAEHLAILQRVRSGEAVRGLETLRMHKDGRRIDVSLTVSPIWNGGSAPAGASTIARDISEAREMREHMETAEHLASIGLMAAGIAHEVNNPLSVVRASVDYVAGELARKPGSAELVSALQQAGEGVTRISAAVEDLRVFARNDADALRVVDVNAVLSSALALVTGEVQRRARLERQLGDVPGVNAAAGKLGQVFLSLLQNAAQALDAGAAQRNVIAVRTFAEGGSVHIEIADTGPGIAPEHLPRLFKPFFTTKPAGVGTGLGLAMCHSIVTAFGGTVGVQSQVGRGTTFRVSLPALAPAPRAQPAAGDNPRARVLVVDDEPMLGRALVRALSAEHDVEVVTDAREALSLATAGREFDIVFCDLMMPNMSGMELHEQLTRVRPDLVERMVFMTGGAFTPASRTFLEQVKNPRLEKPWNPAALKAMVRASVR